MTATGGGPQRVMVVGSGGAGKSTVATRLGARLGLPVVHLDREFWRPGWEPTPPDAWRARVEQLAAAPRWVIDGNYGSTLDVRVPRADLIVFLDLPRRVTVPSVLRRWARWRGRTRPDMHPGCPETVSPGFLGYLWRYPRRGRPRLLAVISAAGADDRLVRLRSRRAARRWLDALAS